MAATKHFDPAYHASLAAWRQRYPEVGEQAAKEMVACLISAAIEADLIWSNVRWWDGECRRHAPHPQEREAPAKWPRTLSADWCGEYKRKRKPAA